MSDEQMRESGTAPPAVEPQLDDEYYTIEEIASRFKVTRQTVYNWFGEGLGYITIGSKRRIGRRALETFIASSSKRTAPAMSYAAA
jgi:excisionase family DNA binding protein